MGPIFAPEAPVGGVGAKTPTCRGVWRAPSAIFAYSTYIQKLTNEAATWLGSALTVASSAVPPARASEPAYVAHAGATREQQPQV